MSELPRLICTCHARGCINQLCTHPDTGAIVSGRVLRRYAFNEHQAQEDVWLRNHHEMNAISAIASTALMDVDLPDAATNAHQGVYSYARSEVSTTNDSLIEGDASGFPRAGLADFASILENTRGNSQSEAGRDDGRERESLGRDHDNRRLNTVPMDSDPQRQLMKTYLDALSEETRQYQHQPILFASPPSSFEDNIPHLESLSSNAEQRSQNSAFLRHHERLAHVLQLVRELGDHDDPALQEIRDTFFFQFNLQIRLLEALVESQWDSEKLKAGFTPPESWGTNLRGNVEVVDTSKLFNLGLDQPPLFVLISIMTAITLYLYTGLSRGGAGFLLQATQLIASATCLAVLGTGGQMSRAVEELTRIWPIDIRTALASFNVDPETLEYACCKQCCACYASPYPEHCTHQETPSSPQCGARLLHRRTNGVALEPIRRFIYQPFKSWVSRFLSRPGIEDMFITSPSVCPGPRLEKDVWDGEAFARFKGPDGKSFFEVTNNELRLVFSLFVDWFNPFGNRASSKSVSVGAIYMVCLNLPIHLRYRMENIYLVGIIPGPKEPSLHQINHFLDILVNDLLSFWTYGVYFSRTAAHRFGRLVRCAIIPLVCDLPGLRKTAGLAGHSHTHLCSFCRITKTAVTNLAYFDWPRRTFAEHLHQARLWRDAASEDIRKTLWKANPIRWTSLLALPYWDITKYSILDAMHNLFLGHFRRHCFDIWHMEAPKDQDLDDDDLELDDDDDDKDARTRRTEPHSTGEQESAINESVEALRAMSESHLKKLRRGYLIVLATLNHAPIHGQQHPNKKTIIHALLSWRSHSPNTDIITPAPFPFPVVNFDNPNFTPKEAVLNKDILRELWHDMDSTVLPSWIGRAPARFGAAGQGRLKADEWRTACTVHLPITLIRLWHYFPDTEREKAMLRNFLSLVTAVLWATRRSTSDTHRTIVQNHFVYYLRSLVELFGPDVLVPNHHVSLHLVECLRLFGPVHGWWAFPFERFNGILQGFNTNSHLGDLKLTFFNTFCRAANFKALMVSSPVVGLMGMFRKLFLRFFGGNQRGTLQSDLLAFEAHATGDESIIEDDKVPKPIDIPDSHYRCLIDRLNRDPEPEAPLFKAYDDSNSPQRIAAQPQASYCSYVSLRGVKYSNFHHSQGDSMIIFSTGSGAPNLAGRIVEVFAHTRPAVDGSPLEEHFLVVHAYRDLDAMEQQHHDPYRHYPYLGIHLCHDELDVHPIVIKAADIISHFGSCPFRRIQSPNLRVVISLARD